MGSAIWFEFIHVAADAFHYFAIGAFAVATHAVTSAGFPPAGGKQQGINMVFHVKPVANIEPIAVEGNGFPSSCFENDDRNQLLWVLPRSVVIGAVRQHDWQAVGVMPGTHQMVTGRFAG